MKKFIADVGGNGTTWKIKEDKRSIDDGYLSTKNKNRDQVIEEMVNIINKENITHVAMAAPGAINTSTGILKGHTGIKGWEYFDLYKEFKKKIKNTDIVIKATNDANAALLGTMLEHANIKYAIQLTIGTGIGGSIYRNGEIIFGNDGFGGEFGYFPSFDDTSSHKTSSTLCSSDGLVSMFDGEYKNVKEIFEKEWNSEKTKLWFRRLGRFIFGINYCFDPEIIFLSGGVTNDDRFITRINECIQQYLDESNIKEKIIVKKSSIKDDVALRGAETLLKKEGK